MILPELCGALSGLLCTLNNQEMEDREKAEVMREIERVISCAQQARQKLAEVPEGVGVRAFFTRPQRVEYLPNERNPSQGVTTAAVRALEKCDEPG